MAIAPVVRRFVLERAGQRCEYCQIVGWVLTIDHLTPRSPRRRPAEQQVGSPADLDHPDNLAAACTQCNRAKWGLTEAEDPFTGLRQPLFNPRRHRWADHFGWSRDYSTIVALSPIGRATVEQLQLNRDVYQLQRLILRAAARGGAPPGRRLDKFRASRRIDQF